MKITLLNTLIDKAHRLAQINSELELLDEKLKTPSRTLDDLVRHIQLLKEKKSLK